MSTSEQILFNLASIDPDYPAFISTLPPDISTINLTEGLADDVASLLQINLQNPSDRVMVQSPNISSEKFSIDPLIAAGTLAAILFLLRSHIKIEGKHIFFEHKPMSNKLLERVLDAIKGILPDSYKG